MDPEGQGRPDLTRAAPPVRLRPGVRFACAGDGLCCSDIHALGPVQRHEASRLQRTTPGVVTRHRTLRLAVLRTVPHAPGGAACTFLRPEGCAAYAERPLTCRRFPLGLVATATGLRVTTDHRCPCRSLGPRPVLSVDAARASLVDAVGRLRPDQRAPDRVHLRARSRVGFARYEREIEAPLLARLLASDAPLDAMPCAPFPPLDGVTWRDVAHLLRGHTNGSSGGEAAAWFGDVLLSMQGQSTSARRTRPWAWAFDRAEQRGEPTTSARVLADWAADEIWSLAWLDRGSWERAALELTTRLAVATEIADRLHASLGLRHDRAAAEAVMMAEIVGALPLWPSVVVSLLPP